VVLAVLEIDLKVEWSLETRTRVTPLVAKPDRSSAARPTPLGGAWKAQAPIPESKAEAATDTFRLNNGDASA